MPSLPRKRVALITASSAGLGAATAKVFASNGFSIVINYHSREFVAKQLIQELEKISEVHPESPRFTAIGADVSQRSEVIRLVDETVQQMGRLDVVVSNHGWTKIRDFEKLEDNVEESDWDRCYNMNVKSHLFLFHAAKKYLEESSGSFISVASLAGVKPSGSSIAYSVTKSAQIHLIKSLALISGPNIRVNSVSPGLLMTEWGQQFDQAKVDGIIAKSPLKRLAIVEDVAQQILCLANSTSTTGANVVIEAGLSL